MARSAWSIPLLLLASVGKAAEPAKTADLDGFRAGVAGFLDSHCVRCHGPAKQEGEFNLKKLNPDLLGGQDAARWKLVFQRIEAGEMPPAGEQRPKPAAAQKATAWLAAELGKAGIAVAKESPRDHPSLGNLVDHDALFNQQAVPGGASAVRLWRISPFIYAELMNQKGNRARISQPFSLLPDEGFKDYAAAFAIDEATMAQLLRNAREVVAVQTAFRVENGVLKSIGQQGLDGKFFLRLMDEKNPPTRGDLATAIKAQFQRYLRRDPRPEESERLVAFMERGIKEVGQLEGARAGLAAVMLLPEVLYRREDGGGPADAQGRRPLSQRELAQAIGYALSDRGPDKLLLDAADKGELKSREEIVKHIDRLFAESKYPKQRLLRFFQEYFGYTHAIEVFKDKKEFDAYRPEVVVADTNQLILHILEKDREVLKELLTTNQSYVNYLADSRQVANREKMKGRGEFFRFYNLDAWPASGTELLTFPPDERCGILTQPSWLIAWSTNFDNNAITRGKWVREKLLGGHVPMLPISVDARLPEDKDKTLRQRMHVTQEAACWKCHQKMNDVGLPFEHYDHFGRYRALEIGKPVDATGLVAFTGDKSLDGPVASAPDLMRRLAASPRVKQVFIRHAFRYWMGRNETLDDAWSLQQIDQAYTKNGGSMKALLTALMTSDAFLYRK